MVEQLAPSLHRYPPPLLARLLNYSELNQKNHNDREHRAHEDIPLYCSAQNEAASYGVAQQATLEKVTPETIMAITVFNRFKLERLWPEIRSLQESGCLEKEIAERRKEIIEKKEQWHGFISSMTQGPWKEMHQELEQALQEGSLEPLKRGGGGAYLLRDSFGRPKFIVKPNDEDILCLHNRKQLASPFNDREHRAREDIPLYHSAQNEAASYAIAQQVNLEKVTPETIMAIINSDRFYDISQQLEGDAQKTFIERSGSPDRVKLCSVQRYIPDTIQVHQALHEWFEAKLDQQGICIPLDQESFEDLLLFLWITYDTDGHSSNLLCHLHKLDEQGKAVYAIKKIDNGLAWPAKHSQMINHLAHLPNAKQPLSPRVRDKLLAIPVETVAITLDQFGLDYAKQAFEERLSVLQELAWRDHLSMEELNIRMGLLALPNGRELALSHLPNEKLIDLILQMNVEMSQTSSIKSDPLARLLSKQGILSKNPVLTLDTTPLASVGQDARFLIPLQA